MRDWSVCDLESSCLNAETTIHVDSMISRAHLNNRGGRLTVVLPETFLGLCQRSHESSPGQRTGVLWPVEGSHS